MAVDYKASGVDVEAGYKAVELMKKHVKTTFTEGVVTDLGGFGGLFSLAKHKMEEPVLVSGTDGVGTKLKVAFLTDKHNTVGIDLVAMCVNDIICAGAEPLFFLDYIACGKNIPEKIADIVSGVAEGCRQSGAALIGGETAEMPGFYPENEYDMAGFAVGIVDKSKVIDGSKIEDGDVLLGLPSSGIHSNGYSLVRKLFNPTKEKLEEYVEELGCTLGEELIKPTKIYVKQIRELKDRVTIKSISHITGGGFIENIPRALKDGYSAKINKGTWPVHNIFNLMQKLGEMEERSIYNTFNMGIGMVLILNKDEAEKAIDILESIGEKGYVIGSVEKGDKGVIIC
ncbi:phosphoribosylformylglycinamidine cyclo-ligase [Vallitalea guaymasensis]|uniref:Phosphoribosylformylglycinamidine cyclo-ligase n=1 Tax=Vallitalea guaymasensis TaxID=1185412 RepID=A0A8J8SD75_9FIRM|nr:phosphoribosylformylglycinamidine cyclo-ligase [Vallitalea guaymasensis]QUH30517.1 phosphoribosylformylglycinamidine cyclo-ligase [Vallitalea guaymasensis]